MYRISKDLGYVRYCGETKNKVVSGEIYDVTVRFNPPKGDYPTAWIKENGRCIAVIPYFKEDWREI